MMTFDMVSTWGTILYSWIENNELVWIHWEYERGGL